MGKYTNEQREELEQYTCEVELHRPNHVSTQVDVHYSASDYDAFRSHKVNLEFWIWASGEDKDGLSHDFGFKINAYDFLSKIATDKNVWLAKRHLEREIKGITQYVSNEEDQYNYFEPFLERVNHSS